jgi:uncharacterized spore protein YtfJ
MEPNELLGAIAAQVRHMARTENIVGDPMTIGDVTLVPITRVMIGFGGGSGGADVTSAKEEGPRLGTGGGGSGGGGGAGVRVEPAAFIVVQHGEVSILAVPGKRGALADLAEHVPDLVEKVASVAAKAKKEAKEDRDD